MGWFSSSSTQEESSLPNRENRRKCWETRDAYFACLDRVSVVKAGEEGNVCSQEKKQYEINCAKSWIEYFNQRRIIGEAQKDRLARTNEQTQSSKK
ncbi:hypothetical protein BYT27DRAFT_7200091 [Phlegmacium glaucopus]|nr:hypothetical protein BYT27DRAFT_7200091 [Phlegmacium glaucopus]